MVVQENTNKAIAFNTLILYIRLFLNTLTTLFATRYALKALGLVDYGLFAVLGGVLSFISIFNTILVATTNRYISVAIGKGDKILANTQFNITVVIHITIAIITAILAVPLCRFYVYNYLNYQGDLNIAFIVMLISLIGSIISFISVPYNGVLIAKERFSVYCVTDIVVYFGKLLLSLSLFYFVAHKLLIYAIGLSILTALPTIVYYLYCKIHFPEIVYFRVIKDKYKYFDILKFSGWVSYGAIAVVGKNQGSQILVNTFFNSIMNASLGLANNINSLINLISQNIAQPVVPQLMKSYACGDYERCNTLLVFSTKFTYLISFLVAFPIMIETEWIFKIWLDEVPPFAVQFTRLLLIDTLITSLNSGISNLIFASGKIKLYQIIVNTLRLMSVFMAFVFLKYGFECYSLMYTYIFFSIIIFFITQWILRKTLDYNNKLLWVKSYVPSIIVTLLCVPLLISSLPFHPICNMLIVTLYAICVIWFVAFNKDERNSIIQLCFK